MARAQPKSRYRHQLVSQRYGWGWGLSTAPLEREPVKDFIILTEFSRCQEGWFGGVSRRPQQLPIISDKDFP
jgi:hypothetical protein